MSARDALEKYSRKMMAADERLMRGPRTNGRPEWELTKKPCGHWFKANGFSIHNIEAKATLSSDGRYIHGQVEPGFSDAVGCTPNGIAVFAEYKAPRCRSSLKEHQREFLIDKIQKGCFAVCVDSVECLEKIWSAFKAARETSISSGAKVLMEHLPKLRAQNQSLPDETGLPF